MSVQKNLREAITIFVIVLLAYGYFSFDLDWNINSRLALVKAFVDEGVFEIDSYHMTEMGTGDKAFINGHYYSDKAIGSSVLGVMIYYPVRWFYSARGVLLSTQMFFKLLTFFAISLPSALIAPFLYLLVKHLTSDSMKALIVTLGISLGTPLFKYSTAYYGHSLAAAAYFFAALIWFYARRRKNVSLRLAFISSVLLGYMVITEYPTALLLSLLAPYILYTLYESGQLFNWKIYAGMAVGFLLPICLLLYYNNSIFGSPFATGYSFEAKESFKLAHGRSFMGISRPDLHILWYQTFQPAFGMFWQGPILVLALPGWFYMFKTRDYRVEAVFSITVVFLYILMFSGYYMWWGGQSFGPRHLIPVLPLFALPLAFVPKKLLIPLTLGLLVSVFQNLVLTASGFTGMGDYIFGYLKPAWAGQHIFEPRGMLVYDICLPNVMQGNLMSNRGMDIFGLNGISSLFPLLFFELGLLLTSLKLFFLKRDPHELSAG